MKELKGVKYVGFGKTSFSEALKKLEKEVEDVKNENVTQIIINNGVVKEQKNIKNIKNLNL